MMRGKVGLMPDSALGRAPAVMVLISRRLRWRERGKRWPDEPVATPSGCTIWLTHRRGRHRRTPADEVNAGKASRLGRGAPAASHAEETGPETRAVGDGSSSQEAESPGGAAPPRWQWREPGTVEAALEGPPLSLSQSGDGTTTADVVAATTAAMNPAAQATARRSCDEVMSISAAQSSRASEEPLFALERASDCIVDRCSAADNPARAQAEPPCAESPTDWRARGGWRALIEGRGSSNERPLRVELSPAWWPPAHGIAAVPVQLRVESALCPAPAPCAPESAEAGEKEARDDAQRPRMLSDDPVSGAAAAVGQGRGVSGASADSFGAPGLPSYSFSWYSREKRCELLVLLGLERAARSSDDFRRVACCRPPWAKKAAASRGSGEGR